MQRLIGLLVALTLVVIPLGMIAGPAAAHSSAPVATDCHGDPSAPQEKQEAPGMSAQCALACAALPAPQVRIEAPVMIAQPAPVVRVTHRLSGGRANSIDPPPRA